MARWVARPSALRLAVLLLGATVYMALGLRTELRFLQIKPLPATLFEDYRCYTQAYAALLHGANPYAGTGFRYTPPALLVIGLLGLLRAPLLQPAFFLALNLSVLALLLWGIARQYGYRPARVWWWYPLAFAFAPFLELLHVGQINVIVAAGLWLAFAEAERRPPLAGFGLALAIVIKITPLAVFAYLLVLRARAAVAWTVAALVAWTLSFVALYGLRPLLEFERTFAALLGGTEPPDGNGQALDALLALHGLVATHGMLGFHQRLVLVLGLVCALSGTLAFLLRQREPFFVVLSLALTVAPNIMWYHHYVLMLPALFAWMGWSRLHPAVVAWCVLGLSVIQVDRWELSDGLGGWGFVALSIAALLAWQGVALLHHARPRVGAAVEPAAARAAGARRAIRQRWG